MPNVIGPVGEQAQVARADHAGLASLRAVRVAAGRERRRAVRAWVAASRRSRRIRSRSATSVQGPGLGILLLGRGTG
jgi:hypothetical protein